MAHALRERLAWYANRLKAMSVPEVVWRVQQKALQKTEKTKFGKRISIADTLLYPDLKDTRFAASLPIGMPDFDAAVVIPAENISPSRAGSASAQPAATGHEGATGTPEWPDEWAYSLRYKQRDDIGDARLAWEAHRHFEWPRLAMETSVGIAELDRRFRDWNHANPLLYGIAWVSVMEVAIRAIQWIFTAAILRHNAPVADDSLKETRLRLETGLLTGAANMISYVIRHRSRYSSANNHLLVELSAIALGGAAFGHDPWTALAIEELERELPRQFSAGGVNLESSLHYHAFAAEAYMHTILHLERAGKEVPRVMRESIPRMAAFIQASMASESTAIEFGDADCGKLTDLTGKGFNYYRYVLQLASAISGKERFTDFDSTEPTARLLTTARQIREAAAAPLHTLPLCATFDASAAGNMKSGYTFLRSADRRILVGIDHAPFGFGSIAAHAHADMLSLQLTEDGKPVLTEGGTYLYHCDLPDRNMRRGELMHNTVALAGHPQGDMRGAFLWGRRGCARMLHGGKPRPDGTIPLQLEAIMADGEKLRRDITFNTADYSLRITDTLLSDSDIVTFIVAPGLHVEPAGDTAVFGHWRLHAPDGTIHTEQVTVAEEYGKLTPATAIRITGRTGKCETTLTYKETD